VENGKAQECNQKQAEQHRQRLESRKRQPESALPARRLLSERRAQIVGRLCHGFPRISRADDTTAGQDRGRPALRHNRESTACGEETESPSKKGGPKAARFPQKLASPA
jgi:hypothetical protein